MRAELAELVAETRVQDAGSRPGVSARSDEAGAACYHCGTPCGPHPPRSGDRVFCCRGCQAVSELLTASGLGHFYDLADGAGARVGGKPVGGERFAHLDDPLIRDRLVDFRDGRLARVTFQVPAMHCVACVWLLENLFRLNDAIGRSQVNFPRRELTLTFDETRLPLSGVVALLHQIGYPPTLRLDAVERGPDRPSNRRLYLQLGVAGFAFGNTMLFSFPGYLGLEGAGSPGLQTFFGVLSLLLALPVLLFSAADYWRAAGTALRQRRLTIELPIALGLAALFGQSAWEILSGTGAGYVDSLAGLVFFLLCGRWFQQKTYARLAFDRDYRAFFPLAVVRLEQGREETVPVARLAVGDRLRLRHGEILPADARLVSGRAEVDYSFVTGEAEPVTRTAGETLYAGGQQTAGAIEVEIVKPVSQSYLASLWGHETFRENAGGHLADLTDRFSRWFILAVVATALGAATGWWLTTAGLGPAVRAFTAVLIVACPCALALAAPFAFGTIQRLLGRAGVFLKHPSVLETLARVNTVVFDKTGTLTLPRAGAVEFFPATADAGPLSRSEKRLVSALARQSTHPAAVRLARQLGTTGAGAVVTDFREVPGGGLEGVVEGRRLRLGSATWLRQSGVDPAEAPTPGGATVWVALDGICRGRFELAGRPRPGLAAMARELASRHRLALVSGDNGRERGRFRALLGETAELRFDQRPLDKLEFVRSRKQAGATVLMAGDGLNDAGALRESDVGVAVVEEPGAFSPASDVILTGEHLVKLPRLLALARAAVGAVYGCIGVSCAYNLVGLSLAARGLLAPWICAILMPLSSVSVVLLASGLAAWLTRRHGFRAGADGRLRTGGGTAGRSETTEATA